MPSCDYSPNLQQGCLIYSCGLTSKHLGTGLDMGGWSHAWIGWIWMSIQRVTFSYYHHDALYSFAGTSDILYTLIACYICISLSMAASSPSENLRSQNPSLNTTSGITRCRSNRIANIPVNENSAIIEPSRKKRKTGP